MTAQPTPPAHARIYGDDSPDSGPRPGSRYRELVAGPLDGLWVNITAMTPEEVAGGFALMSDDGGTYGPGGRSLYDPADPDDGRLHWSGDIP